MKNARLRSENITVFVKFEQYPLHINTEERIADRSRTLAGR